MTIPYVANVSEKIRRILKEHEINTTFKPGNTLRQILVHPKDKVKKEKKSGVVYGISCSDPTCKDVYIGETAQPLHKRMYQHRRPSTSGFDSAVYTHLEEKDHSFDNSEVKILDNEPRWFERGVREAIYERVEKPSLNKRGGLRFNLSRTWDRALRSVPRVLSSEHVSQRDYMDYIPSVPSQSSDEANRMVGETVSSQ